MVICQECGSANPPGATECSVCGEEIRPQAQASATGEKEPPPPRRPRPVWLEYLMFGGLTAVIALVIYFVARPVEHTGPAAEQPGGAQQQPNGLPPGHPPTDEHALTEAQSKEIEALKGKVAANPSDLDAQIRLANVLYDANRHQEALQYYRAYLAARPTDVDARTDMAFSLYETGQPDSAITLLNQVIAVAPKHQNAAYNLAMMYVAKRNRDSVLFWLRRVIAIDSTSAQAQRAVQLIQALQEAHTGTGGGM